ncbi:4Fe-4S ferredoxin [Anaerosporomusa subterranea]|uniref:4Fe-4S ferredoxin n=1 Tax=Anaerosporomusa subterranea TaxID=1794912 RepID=A0A154BQD0_ANASB|nr:4Fe-4S binding protein [Anaerosporomusa subterranea]KYZ76109.1 4Fe-4S ferredoxin [Anaerosporomusa subterranea]
MNNRQLEVTANLPDQKERIKDFVLGLGVDDVGIAAVSSYNSPKSAKMESIFPEAQSMIVLAYKEPSNCDSPNRQIAINGRLDLIEFSQSCNYRLARFLEKEYDARAMTVPYSFPIDMNKRGIADVSLRHAAVAAGLGSFGRHNLVIHPKHGARLIFTAILCDIDLPSDPPVKENLCNRCNICVESCPVGALNAAGKTDVDKCSPHIQPHGLRGTISFWRKFVDSAPEEQKEMFLDNYFMELWQAGIVKNMYVCFNCRNSCPVGQSKK